MVVAYVSKYKMLFERKGFKQKRPGLVHHNNQVSCVTTRLKQVPF